jgi:hypothetical protein
MIVLLALAIAARADDRIANSKHDLSAMGPGPTRAVNESEICIFCHTPHNASPVAPLWNRYNPTTYYRIYRSPSLQARVDQPGPASKLCLSCHDGTVALGLVLNRPFTNPIPMNHPYITGPADLTTDLSDDHPIGFRYDQQLANVDPKSASRDWSTSESNWASAASWNAPPATIRTTTSSATFCASPNGKARFAAPATICAAGSTPRTLSRRVTSR